MARTPLCILQPLGEKTRCRASRPLDTSVIVEVEYRRRRVATFRRRVGVTSGILCGVFPGAGCRGVLRREKSVRQEIHHVVCSWNVAVVQM